MSHIRGAVALHRNARREPSCYRGPKTAVALYWFYDACANRDYSVGACVLGGDGKPAAVVCGATRATGAEDWLTKRRRWRALAARIIYGSNIARGGWPVESLNNIACGERSGFLFALNYGVAVDDEIRALFNTFIAAMASRGVSVLYAPSMSPDEMLVTLGFEAAGRLEPVGNGGYLYRLVL